jgi:hypothetical protein
MRKLSQRLIHQADEHCIHFTVCHDRPGVWAEPMMLLHQTLTEFITSICMFGYSLCPNFKFPVILSNLIFLKTYVTANVSEVLRLILFKKSSYRNNLCLLRVEPS